MEYYDTITLNYLFFKTFVLFSFILIDTNSVFYEIKLNNIDIYYLQINTIYNR